MLSEFETPVVLETVSPVCTSVSLCGAAVEVLSDEPSSASLEDDSLEEVCWDISRELDELSVFCRDIR